MNALSWFRGFSARHQNKPVDGSIEMPAISIDQDAPAAAVKPSQIIVQLLPTKSSKRVITPMPKSLKLLAQ